MSQKSNYGLKRFIAIADSYVNPDTSTPEGIEKSLILWFCEKFNTVPWDDRLKEATLEDLLVFYYMHEIRKNPSIVEELDENYKSFEEWLKEEMGEDYVSEEEMTDEMIKYEKEEVEKAKELDLPEEITTDFSSIMESKDGEQDN